MIADLKAREASPESAEVQRLLEAFRSEMRERYVNLPDLRAHGRKEPVAPEGLTPPDGRFFGLYEGDELVACGGIRLLGEGVAEIKRMYVKPELRGRGYGRRMLTVLEDAARTLGCDRVRLDTGIRQPEAQTLYLSAGYEPTPADSDLPGEIFLAEKRLRLE